MACDDRANIDVATQRYIFPGGNPPAVRACHPNSNACEKTSSVHHNNINEFMICNNCITARDHITSRPRRHALAGHAGLLHRSHTFLLQGTHNWPTPTGAWDRGQLCDPCINREIMKFHERQYVGYRRRQGHLRGVCNTCECDRELRKHYCVEDRIALCHKIQNKSDNVASHANVAAWLRHIEYDAQLKRAVFVPNNAALARRQGAMVSDYACRCGRDVPLGAAPPDSPVKACTACSGVIINTAHARVTNFRHATRQTRSQNAAAAAAQQVTLEQNLDYNRFPIQ